MTLLEPIEDGDNVGEAFEKINRALARTDLTHTTHVLTKQRFGRWKTITLTEATTFQITMEVESHHNRLRIAIPNLSPNPVVGVKAATSCFHTWYQPNYYSHPYPDINWRTVQWDEAGTQTVTLPGRIAEEVPSWTYSTLHSNASIPREDVPGGRPIVTIRLQYPAGSVVTVPYNEFYGWRSEPNIASMRVTKQAVLGVDTPLNYTATSSTDVGCPIPAVQYISRVAGRQLMAIGDSTTEGVGPNTRCFGPVARVCRNLSTLSGPVEYFNCGMHAQGQAAYIKQLAHLPRVNPTILVYQPYTINDTPNGGMAEHTYQAYWDGTAKVADAARANNKPMHLVFLEGLPCNTAFRNLGPGDQDRLDLNLELQTSYSGIVTTPGYAAAISGEVVNGQVQIAAGLTGDNVHPNEAGSDALAAVLQPILEAL